MANLVSITEYKTYASIASTDSDAKLTILVPAVSNFVRTYCGRNFINQTTAAPVGTEAPVVSQTELTQYFSDGGRLFYVNESPVINVISLEQKTYPGSAYSPLTEYVDYEYDISGDYFVSLCRDGFPRMPNAIKLTYTGGYTSLPEELKLGIFSLIQYYMKNESSPRKSINHNQISAEYVTSADLPPHIKRVFDLYRIIN